MENETNVKQTRTNGFGVAGFVLAILGIVFGWVPYLGQIIWLLGLIFSCIGMAKAPRGLAITGFILSFLDLILMLTVFGAIVAGVIAAL